MKRPRVFAASPGVKVVTPSHGFVQQYFIRYTFVHPLGYEAKFVTYVQKCKCSILRNKWPDKSKHKLPFFNNIKLGLAFFLVFVFGLSSLLLL